MKRTARSILAILFITTLVIGLCATPAHVGADDNPGTTNLISCWSMNETSGTRADSYGTNSLTDNNTVDYNTGKQGNAASFTSANSEYLSHADNASLSTGDIDFTIGGWFYITSLADAENDILGKWKTSTNNREFLLDTETTSLKFYVSSNGTATTNVAWSSALSTSTWYFVVAWHDAVNNTLNIQVNDGTAVSSSYSSGVLDSAAYFGIGGIEKAVDYYDGRIDEVFFYKRVLTANERTWLYNTGTGKSCADLNPAPTNTPTQTASQTASPTASQTPSQTATATVVPVNPGITNLILCLPLDETSGTRYSAINSIDFADHSTVGYATGVQGNAANFQKANSEYLSHSDDANVSTGDIDFTIGVWVKLTTKTTDGFILSKWSSTAPQQDYLLWYDAVDDHFKFDVSAAGGVHSLNSNTASPSTGTWYFVVAWHDSVNNLVGISVDNSTAYTESFTYGVRDSDSDMTVGSRSDGASSFLDGDVDEAVLYKRILTAGERSWLYNSGSGRSCNDFVPTPTPTSTFTFTPSPSATNSITPSPTSTSTETATPTMSITPGGPTLTPGPIPTYFFEGTITYGEYSTTIAVAILTMFFVLAFITWLILSTLHRKRSGQ